MKFGQEFEKIFFKLSLLKPKYLQSIKRGYYTSEDIDSMHYLAISQPDRQKETFTQHALLKYHSKGNTENAMEGLKRAIQLGLIEQIKDEVGKETYEIKINPFI